MAPEDAVCRLAEIIAARTDFTEDDVYAAMTAAGIPAQVADRAYKMTQTAWGRGLLDGVGVKFGADYYWFNRAGVVVENGHLVDDPYYAAAVRLLPQEAQSPGFRSFTLMSAEVRTVNRALHAGSKPENLAMGPAGFFAESPTPLGMAKVQKFLSLLAEFASAQQPDRPGANRLSADKKPWWRFW